ncbi:hypothetical protein COV13_00990 [Candidatus Woesearchaeota archaeon CG10_big_fil_rev_8_21_14_0_10_32_9]|nr:MAG: hypothetical protein COV13_00990 [Candidatus Woesearchaeota archaeon CG10_big_fil_rev_8_21_14_0_10_32_9]
MRIDKIDKGEIVELTRTNTKYIDTLKNIIALVKKLEALHNNNLDVKEDLNQAIQVIKSYTGKELNEAKKIGATKILYDVREEINVVMKVVKDANSNNQNLLKNLESDFLTLEDLLQKLEKDLKELEKKN